MTKKIISSRIQLFLNSLKQRGIAKSLLISLHYFIDYYFDIKYGTDTISTVCLKNMEVDNDKKVHAKMYQPTKAIPLRKLMKALKIPSGKVLIDLGCGKGRVLLIASEFGFKEVRGVEFSPSLCNIARKNSFIYRDKTKTKTDFAIIESDVLDYAIKDDEDVFFLFNPFDAYVLNQVLQGIILSLKRRKRKIWIIYRNALHRKTVEDAIKYSKSVNYTFQGQEFVVFEVEP